MDSTTAITMYTKIPLIAFQSQMQVRDVL